MSFVPGKDLEGAIVTEVFEDAEGQIRHMHLRKGTKVYELNSGSSGNAYSHNPYACEIQRKSGGTKE